MHDHISSSFMSQKMAKASVSQAEQVKLLSNLAQFGISIFLKHCIYLYPVLPFTQKLSEYSAVKNMWI